MQTSFIFDKIRTKHNLQMFFAFSTPECGGPGLNPVKTPCSSCSLHSRRRLRGACLQVMLRPCAAARALNLHLSRAGGLCSASLFIPPLSRNGLYVYTNDDHGQLIVSSLTLHGREHTRTIIILKYRVCPSWWMSSGGGRVL